MGKGTPWTVGEKHGRLTFLERTSQRGEPAKGRFRCDCGVEVEDVRLNNVRGGHTTSCGCYQREAASAARSIHGMCDTPIYRCWQGMLARSTPGSRRDRESPTYQGIGRDPRWDTFEAFYADMGDTYFKGAVLARYGDTGDYTPKNARWITRGENSREMQERRMLRMSDGRFGRDVAQANGIAPQVFVNRVQRGWTVDDAATRPT